GADHEGIAVEDQLVVPADQIAVRDGNAVLRGKGAQHLEPALRFSEEDRRGAEVQDDLGALGNEGFNRREVVKPAGQVARGPDVLADCDAYGLPGDCDGANGGCRLKIAVFVEGVVAREEGLEDLVLKPAVLEHGGGIVKRLPGAGIRLDVSDDERDGADLDGEGVEQGEIEGNEA